MSATKYIARPDTCEECEFCIPIGDGDFLCEELGVIIARDYLPTEEYQVCKKEER